MTDGKLKHPAAERNAQVLSAWITATPLHDIPVNQFGDANISKILAKLNISRSSAETNPKIQRAFVDLNKSLKAAAKPKALKADRSLAQLEEKQKEILRLKQRLSRFEALFNDGIWIA